jgi:hypothetical protein
MPSSVESLLPSLSPDNVRESLESNVGLSWVDPIVLGLHRHLSSSSAYAHNISQIPDNRNARICVEICSPDLC